MEGQSGMSAMTSDFVCTQCKRTVAASRATSLRCPYCQCREFQRRQPKPLTWTATDRQFLRSIRVAVDEDQTECP